MIHRLAVPLFLAIFLSIYGTSFGQNLEGHWTFDSDFTDSTTNNRDGTGASGASVGSNITSAAGEFTVGTGALTLGGGNEHVAITGYKGVNGTAARTVSAWIKADAPNDNQAIMSWGTDSNAQKWIFRIQDGNGPVDGGLRIEVNGGYRVGTTDLDDGNWHHVALSFSNDGSPNVNDTLLYVDGVLEVVSASLGNAINTLSGQDVLIGQDHSSREWIGGIDDAGIFSEELSAEKIQAIYDLATNSELGYDLSDDDVLFDTFGQGAGASVEIDGLLWQFVGSGLTPGLTGSDGSFSLGLDASSGAGLQSRVIPEPASVAIWSLIGFGLVTFGYIRRRRKS